MISFEIFADVDRIPYERWWLAVENAPLLKVRILGNVAAGIHFPWMASMPQYCTILDMLCKKQPEISLS